LPRKLIERSIIVLDEGNRIDNHNDEEVSIPIRTPIPRISSCRYVFSPPSHKILTTKELETVAEMYEVELIVPECPMNERFVEAPFLIVHLPNDEVAEQIAKRCLTVFSVCTLDAYGTSVEEVLEGLKEVVLFDAQFYRKHMPGPFKYEFSSFQSSSIPFKAEFMKQLSQFGLVGRADLNHPRHVWKLSVDYNPLKQIQFIYFGKFIGNGCKEIVNQYSLKTRNFIGVTSMDPWLSLLMANMAKTQPGDLIFDPFVGTGSMLYAAAHFGGYVMGSDIDGRQFRGSGIPSRAKHQWKQDERNQSLESNLSQYGLGGRMIDVWVSDLTSHSLRFSKDGDGWIDGIITDPPYGIRAGARKVKALRSLPFTPTNLNRYPETETYTNDSVLCDLLDFSAMFLKRGGRVVYWLPTLANVFSPTDIPNHPSLVMKHHSTQSLNGWDRIMITMEKIGPYRMPEFETAWNKGFQRPEDVPHAAFREWYYKRETRNI
jgi:tRNA (guanine10-N2)-methyltransferase